MLSSVTRDKSLQVISWICVYWKRKKFEINHIRSKIEQIVKFLSTGKNIIKYTCDLRYILLSPNLRQKDCLFIGRLSDLKSHRTWKTFYSYKSKPAILLRLLSDLKITLDLPAIHHPLVPGNRYIPKKIFPYLQFFVSPTVSSHLFSSFCFRNIFSTNR